MTKYLQLISNHCRPSNNTGERLWCSQLTVIFLIIIIVLSFQVFTKMHVFKACCHEGGSVFTKRIYCTLCRIRNHISCHSRTSVLTISLSRRPDTIIIHTVQITTNICSSTWNDKSFKWLIDCLRLPSGGSTIKSPSAHTVTSQYPSCYDLRCC